MKQGEPFGFAVVREMAVARDPGLADRPVVGYGVATVDIDRVMSFSWENGAVWDPAPRDELLGARAVIGRVFGSGDPPREVLLEPDTEGRLAASLARFGEGLAAIYLAASAPGTAPDASAEVRYGRRAGGPLGPGRLLLGGPAWGPHVIVLDPDGGTP